MLNLTLLPLICTSLIITIYTIKGTSTSTIIYAIPPHILTIYRFGRIIKAKIEYFGELEGVKLNKNLKYLVVHFRYNILCQHFHK